jgi:[acyl-carrier-protein] S-malonyltransferase
LLIPKSITISPELARFAIYFTAVEKLRLELPGVIESCTAVAGFSLGELTALVFGGALSFEDGLRLVKLRAQAMQQAAELVPSGLMTVIFAANAKVKFACKAATEYCLKAGVDPEYAVCSEANYLFPHCKVLGGHVDALKFIEANAKDFGIKRCKRLPVSGAFHTRLMRPAQHPFQEALNRVPLVEPRIAIFSNVDAEPYTNTTQIRRKLALQLTTPVKWQQTMEVIYSRLPDEPYPKTFECGPGASLITILKSVNLKARQEARHFPA